MEPLYYNGIRTCYAKKEQSYDFARPRHWEAWPLPVLTLCVGDIKCLFDDWRLLLQAGLTMEDSIKVVTSNPARRAGLQRSKGRLDVGMDADLLILNRDLGIDSMLARGRLMVDRGKVLTRGTVEE